MDASSITDAVDAPEADTAYYITNVSNSSLVVQVDSDDPSAGDGVNVNKIDGDANQAFTFELQNDGTYIIRSVADSSLVLTADSLSVRGGTSMQEEDSSLAQRWIIEYLNSSGAIHLLSASNTYYMLDTNGTPTKAGASCIMWFDNSGSTQMWTLNEVDASTLDGAEASSGTSDGKYYRIVSVSNPDVCVQLDTTVLADGSYANMAYISDSVYQVWTIEENADGTYYIRSYGDDSLVLTAYSLGTRANVGGYTTSTSRYQKWTFESTGSDGAVRIISASNSSYMLDTAGSTTKDSAACIMWTRNTGTTQQFKLVEVDINNLSEGTVEDTTSTEATYTYQNAYSMTIEEMIGYQKTNTYYNASTQATDLVYAVDPTNFSTTDGGFYQFLRLDTGYSGVTAAELDAYISSTSSGKSGSLQGMGYAFVIAAQTYSKNEENLKEQAKQKTGNVTNTLATGYYYDGTTAINGVYYPAGTYYNFYGIGAVDSSVLSGGRALAISEGWDTPEAAILGAAEWIYNHYTVSSSNNSYMAQNTLYEMRWHSQYSAAYAVRAYHQYATGTSWAYKIAEIMANCYEYTGNTPENAEYLIPVYSVADTSDS